MSDFNILQHNKRGWKLDTGSRMFPCETSLNNKLVISDFNTQECLETKNRHVPILLKCDCSPNCYE